MRRDVQSDERMIEIVRRELGCQVRGGARLLLAVSGGSDSLGLLELAVRAAPSLRLELCVGFVDHGLRDGTDAELRLVERRARENGLEVKTRVIPGRAVLEQRSRGGDSTQAWAREWRYDLLADMAREVGAAFVATGHTLDDQAETVLMRMLRGTGLDGLRAMPRARPLDENTMLVRPLLTVCRAEIRRFLASAGLEWADDPSNQDLRYTRVRVRQQLLPLLEDLAPGSAGRIAVLARESSRVVDLLDRELLEEEKILRPLRLNAGIRVPAARLRGLPEVLVERVVRRALKRVRGDSSRLERSHVSELVHLLAKGGRTDAIPLPGEAVAYAHDGALFAFPCPVPPAPTGTGEPRAVGPGTWRVRFAALGAYADVHGEDPREVRDLVVRARRPGDRLLGSERKLKSVFSRAMIPRPYRDFVPVLARGSQVVSVPALVPSRATGLDVSWGMESEAPFLDVDFS